MCLRYSLCSLLDYYYRKKQILAISEEKNRTKSPDGKVSDIKNASESISRAGLTHLAYDEQCKKDEVNFK